MVRFFILLILINYSAKLSSQERQIAVPFNQPAELTGNAGEDLEIYENVPYSVGTRIEIGGGIPEYSYLWVTPLADTIHSMTFLLVNSTGTFHLVVIDGNNCTFRDSVKVSYVTYTKQLNDILPQIFPNPADEYLHYRVPTGNAPADLSLLNAQGQLVFNRTISAESAITEGELDIRGIPPGAYIVRVRTSFAEYTDKVIIKR